MVNTAEQNDWADDLALAQRAALAGAALGLCYFERVRQLPQELKADGSIVTEADRAVEATVRDTLRAAWPTDAFLGEETGASGSGERRWILDGIDGTAVFVQGDDRWQSLIALEVAGQIIVGVAIVPAQRQLWWATRGGGAFVAAFAGGRLGNGRRLAVATPAPDLAASRLGILPPFTALPPERRAIVAPLDALTPEQPWYAHAALLVAAGELDLAAQVGGQLWDYAALSLIVEEAGGVCGGVAGWGYPLTGTAIFAASRALGTAALAQLAPIP